MTITIDYNELSFGRVQRNARIASQGQQLNQNNNYLYAHKVNQSCGFWVAAGVELTGSYADAPMKDILGDSRVVTHIELHAYGNDVSIKVSSIPTVLTTLSCGSTEGWYKVLIPLTIPGPLEPTEFSYQYRETGVGFLKGCFLVGLHLTDSDLP